MRRFLFSSLLLALGAGCPASHPDVPCLQTSDCNQLGGGSCDVNPATGTSWCSYPDPECPNGRRWGDTDIGDGLEDTCQGVVDAAPADAALPGSTAILVPSATTDALYVVDPATLAVQPTKTLPDRVGNGSLGVAVTSRYVWVKSIQQVTALQRDDLTTVAGYPYTLTGKCFASAAVFVPSALFCPYDATITGSGTSQLLSYSVGATGTLSAGVTAALTSPGVLALTPSRLYAVHGLNVRSVAAFDVDLQPVAGSPTAASTAGNIEQIAASDAAGYFAVSAGSEVEVFARDTLASVKRRTLPAKVSSMVFDPVRDRLIVATEDGFVGALHLPDLVDDGERAQRANTAITHLAFDPSRGKFYGIASSALLVLDAASLAHVAGSPVTLPTPGGGVDFIAP